MQCFHLERYCKETKVVTSTPTDAHLQLLPSSFLVSNHYQLRLLTHVTTDLKELKLYVHLLTNSSTYVSPDFFSTCRLFKNVNYSVSFQKTL
jgi:hypothetical protein